MVNCIMFPRGAIWLVESSIMCPSGVTWLIRKQYNVSEGSDMVS